MCLTHQISTRYVFNLSASKVFSIANVENDLQARGKEMKFSFINPSPSKLLVASASWPPLGILYLATTLRERGIDVSVLDQPAKGFTVEETVKWVAKEDPDLLGFSTFANSFSTATKISKTVKKQNSNITTIFGNYFATFNAERILRKYPAVDLIVRGEGETTVVDLVDCLKKKHQLKKVLGITFRGRDTIVSTPDRLLIDDLDSIPFPDRSLLDVEYRSMIAGAQLGRKKFTSIVSSRGCPYNCRFCGCQQLARSRWRQRSVENTLEELLYLTSAGYQQFMFVDDSFTLNQKRVINLCKRIRQEKLDIEWSCEGRVDRCPYDMMKELPKAGCHAIYFGIESANQRLLDYYNKKITPQQSENAVKTARKAGIDMIIGAFIVGALDETREEMQNTFKFAKRLPIDFPQFNVLTAYPGMDIWNELIRKGHLNKENHWENGVFVSQLGSSAVPFHEIQQMIHDAYIEYLLRPRFLVRQVARLLISPYRREILRTNWPLLKNALVRGKWEYA